MNSDKGKPTHRGQESGPIQPGASLREAGGLLLGTVLLAIVYYHGHIAALPGRAELFGWFGINFLVLFVVPALIITLIWKQSLRRYGLQWGRAGAWTNYLLLYALALVPVLIIASRIPVFQQYYPRYQWAKTEVSALLLSIGGWGVYFFAWEFFFRGFLLNLLAPRYGAFAIIVQTVPFVMMHFPKPELECFAALVAGLALGLMAFRGKSFVGAWLLHWGAATAMDLLVIFWPAQ